MTISLLAAAGRLSGAMATYVPDALFFGSGEILLTYGFWLCSLLRFVPPMSKDKLKKRKITSAEAVKILEQNGLKISEQEAEEVLDFLYFLGKLSVDQYINLVNNANNSNYENS